MVTRMKLKPRRLILLAVVSCLLFGGASGIGRLLYRGRAIATGIVVDLDSGEPVENAKVIVTTWRRYLVSVGSPKSFGTTTDVQGQFHVDVVPGYWISHIDVAASTPDDKYAFQTNFRNESFHLRAGNKLSEEERELPSYHYDTFVGPWDVEVNWLDNAAKNGTP